MTRNLFSLSLFFISFSILAETKPDTLKKSMLLFEENKGQVCDQAGLTRTDILFSGQNNRTSYFLRNNGISYQFCKADQKTAPQSPRDIKKEIPKPMDISIFRLDVTWLGTNLNEPIKTENAIADHNNYYPDAFPDGLTFVRSYIGITYTNIYYNIDLHYYSNEGSLKYDYIVAPYADYSQIKLKVDGAEKITVKEDGSVVFTTPFGEMQEGAPLVFQDGRQLMARWIVQDNILSFDITDYDPSRQMVIDPVTILWGTYCGGSNTDKGHSVVTDTSGNVYLSGVSFSTDNIATTGSHQYTGAASGNMFLVKYNSAGTRQWGTFYGDSSGGQSSVTDLKGNIFVCGQTYGFANIATTGSHQPAFAGNYDAFLVKFNSSGVRQWATYYGGSDIDIAYSCAADQTGSIYICGKTYSYSGIATSSAFQTSIYSGYDAFLAKFNNNGVRQWGTYLGGSGNDDGSFCHVDKAGNIYFTGTTTSTSSMASSGAYQTTNKGYENAFLAKFSNTGARNWCTYYGGSNSTYGSSCNSDKNGFIYLCGSTESKSDIATTGVHQDTTGGTVDAFITKFSNTGARQWGSYVGGKYNDWCSSMTTDTSGSIFVGGWTSSATGIATKGSFKETYSGGVNGKYDGFLNEFNSSGARISGTYFGNTEYDFINGITTYKPYYLYVAGETESTSGIATSGSQQSSLYAYRDAFLIKFCNAPPAPINKTDSAALTICSRNSVVLKAKGRGIISWYTAATGGKYLGAGTSYTSPVLTTTTTFFAQDSTCAASERTAIIVKVIDSSINNISAFTCDSFKLNAITYYQSGTYKQKLINAKGCDSIITLTLKVRPIDTAFMTEKVCSPFVLNNKTYDTSGTYTQSLKTYRGCDSLIILDLKVTLIDTGITLSGNTLSSNTANATYQWLDCDNNLKPINGETSRSYITKKSGNYAVKITLNNCTDTSACMHVTNLGISATDINQSASIYPNPSTGLVNISLSVKANITISDISGRTALSGIFDAGDHALDLNNCNNGIYLVRIVTSGIVHSQLISIAH